MGLDDEVNFVPCTGRHPWNGETCSNCGKSRCQAMNANGERCGKHATDDDGDLCGPHAAKARMGGQVDRKV